MAAINGNMSAPAAATIEWFRARDIGLIPGDGFLPAGVCAVPDALITVLDRYGRLTLEQVLAPAIELAANGFPMYEGMLRSIVENAARLREWPTSAAVWLPNGEVPRPRTLMRTPATAATYRRILAEAASADIGASSLDGRVIASSEPIFTPLTSGTSVGAGR